jgi:hypothetical protein
MTAEIPLTSLHPPRSYASCSHMHTGPLVIATATPSHWLNPPSAARLMHLRVYDSRDSSHQSAPSPSLYYSLTHAHSTLSTPTLLTITCTQVLWFLERLTRPVVSCCVTTTRLTVCLPARRGVLDPSVMRGVLDPSVSALSLSLYQHPFIYTLFSSRFTLIINNNKFLSR